MDTLESDWLESASAPFIIPDTEDVGVTSLDSFQLVSPGEFVLLLALLLGDLEFDLDLDLECLGDSEALCGEDTLLLLLDFERLLLFRGERCGDLDVSESPTSGGLDGELKSKITNSTSKECYTSQLYVTFHNVLKVVNGNSTNKHIQKYIKQIISNKCFQTSYITEY